MKKTTSKKVNVRKQLKIKLENTLTRYKNTVGFRPTPQQAYHWFRIINRGLFNSRYQWCRYTSKNYIRIGADAWQTGTIERRLKENLTKELFRITLMLNFISNYIANFQNGKTL